MITSYQNRKELTLVKGQIWECYRNHPHILLVKLSDQRLQTLISVRLWWFRLRPHCLSRNTNLWNIGHKPFLMCYIIFPSGTIYFRAQDKDGILLMSAFCVYCCCSPLFLSSVLMAHLNKALNVSRLSILIFVLNFFHYDTFKVIPQCASCTAQKNHVIGRIGARENTVSFFQ